MAFEKAHIILSQPKTGSADEVQVTDIKVLFNPTEFTITRHAQWAEIPILGLQMPLQQFVRGESWTLQVELFLDGSDERRSVRDNLENLRQLVIPSSTSHAPPIVTFRWGGEITPSTAAAAAAAGTTGGVGTPSIVDKLSGETTDQGSGIFRGVTTQLTERFVLFDESGEPLRARVTLQLKSFATPSEQRTALGFQSPDRTHTHVVREGDRLWLLAQRVYSDPNRWREIAEANDIERPLLLSPGTILELPSL